MQEKLHFEKLTLNDNTNISVYEDAIDYVFESPDIKNIAISGAYGAGKSSVLATYKKKHPDKKYIHISLAHFKEEYNEDNNITESVLEGKILNQLIHQIPADKIPQTNFKVKQNFTVCDIIKITSIIMLLFLFALLIGFRGQWSSFVMSLNPIICKFLAFTTNQNFIFLLGILATVAFSYAIYILVKAQKNKKLFKRVNLQGNEIEIFEDKEESYFDKYLNEVLYLFENTDADVIVFEDMDRFELNHIFERLREINTLANIQLQKKDKVLRFFYLLRDDVFVSKDRTKFFDYIIPIVPVVDGTNSYDQFIAHLKNNNLLEKFDKKFLQGISLYIDDMRLLKNICNEYLIYYNRLNTIELDCNKMFAIVTYKNLFPRDFSDLQIGKGYVHSLFSHKEEFIKREAENMHNNIDAKKVEISACENELLRDEEELEIIKASKEAEYKKYPFHTENYRTLKKDYEQWVEEVYPIRQDSIKNKKAKKLPRLKMELINLNTSLSKLYSQDLKNIITRENSNEIFHVVSINEVGIKEEFLEIKGSDYFSLLKYLIWNGYIDETYADYMTYFYENSLSRTDKIFLRSVRDKKSKEHSYALKNCELVVSYLSIHDFSQIEILNFDLFTFMIKKMPESKYFDEFICQLKENDNFSFVVEYFSYNENMNEYVSVLNEHWPELFSELLNQNISPEQLRKYLIASICSSSDKEISSINIDGCLTKYISQSKDFLNIEGIDVEKCIRLFEQINVKFVEIDYDVSNKPLFREVYNHSLYELNYNNVKLMLKIIYNEEDERIKRSNCTVIFSKKDSPIYSYVQNNIEEYMNIVVNSDVKVIEDEEDTIVEILNNTDLSVELKKSYIKKISKTISTLVNITQQELWGELLGNNKVCKSVENIYAYYLNFKVFDKTLVNYINSFDTQIDMSQIDISDEIASELFTSCIKAYSLADTKYQEILSSMHRVYNNGFSTEGVPNSKMNILIDNNIIKMSKSALESLRDNYPDSCLRFIKHNIKEYINIMEEDLFSHEELLEILTWDVDEGNKIKLLGFEKEPISIRDVDYSTGVTLYILNNNFDESDIGILYDKYELCDSKIQDFIYGYATQNINTVCEMKKKLPKTLIINILKGEDITSKEKIELFVNQIPYISREEGRLYSETFSVSGYEMVFDSHKKPKFEINDTNTYVLEAFEKAGWIYEFYEDDKKEGYYVIRRNKPTKKKKLDVELL